jgi:hypothetical protein
MISDQPRIGDLVFASRSGGTPIVGYRKRWLNIAKLDDLPANITSHMLRHGFASLAADLGSRPCRETDPSPLMDTSEHGFRSCYHPTRDQSHQRMRKAARTAPKPWRMRTRGHPHGQHRHAEHHARRCLYASRFHHVRMVDAGSRDNNVNGWPQGRPGRRHGLPRSPRRLRNDCASLASSARFRIGVRVLAGGTSMGLAAAWDAFRAPGVTTASHR